MTAAETEAPGTSGEGRGAAPNPQEGLEPRRDIRLVGSPTVAPGVVREISPALVTPGGRPEDLVQDPKY